MQEFNINQYLDNLFNKIGYLFNTSEESVFYKISTFIGSNIGLTLNCYFLVVPTWIIQDGVSEVFNLYNKLDTQGIYEGLFYNDQFEELNFTEQCPKPKFLETF